MTEESAEETWESRYRDSERVWSGDPNRALVDVATELTPGTALDLGSGEGADAVWLADRGWRVTGVDVSPTALGRAADAADAAGIPADRIQWLAEDLATWTPSERYDLVCACFLHSPVELPRATVLQRAAAAVASHGHLLIVGHAAAPPWAAARHEGEMHEHDFPSVQEQLAELALPDGEWEVLLAETRPRDTIGPDGVPASLEDVIVFARRLL